MGQPHRTRPGRRGTLTIAAAMALAVVVYLALGRNGTEADYRSAVARFGEERIDLLVTATMPLGFAKLCHDRFGEDAAMIAAAAGHIQRNEQATTALIADFEATGAMTENEKLAVEATVMRRVDAAIDSEDGCREAAVRIDSGAYDLPVRPSVEPEAQAEGN